MCHLWVDYYGTPFEQKDGWYFQVFVGSPNHWKNSVWMDERTDKPFCGTELANGGG